MSGEQFPPGRRPVFFEGRLLTADDLVAEQDYHRSRRRLHDRTVLGDGVVGGLAVEPAGTAAGGATVVVGPGLALDAWGREIVMAEPVEVGPLAAGEHTVEVRYREEGVDPTADGQPTAVVEGCEVCVRDGHAPPAPVGAPAEVVEALAAGDLRRALCLLASAPERDDRAEDGDEPAVVLANVTVDEGGGVAVDGCGPRRVAPTNRVLARLVAAMAGAEASAGGRSLT